jgi:hypothetical protein
MPSIYIPVETRRTVIERAQGRCEYCQSRADYATETFAVDHIIALSQSGTSELDNLALACSGCNGRKFNKLHAPDPADGAIVPLFHPRQQKWEDHFGWSEDYMLIIGLTPTGRATIEALQMNRTGLINMREALYLLGKHPPLLAE